MSAAARPVSTPEQVVALRQFQRALGQAGQSALEVSCDVLTAFEALAKANNSTRELYGKLSTLRRSIDDASLSIATLLHAPTTAAAVPEHGYDYAGTSPIGHPAIAPNVQIRQPTAAENAVYAASLSQLLSAARPLTATGRGGRAKSTAAATTATATARRSNAERTVIVVPGVCRPREESVSRMDGLPVSIESSNNNDLPNLR